MKVTSYKSLNDNKVSLYGKVSGAKTFYRCICFNTIDTVTNCIEDQFSQPEYQAIKNIEQLISNVISGLGN